MHRTQLNITDFQYQFLLSESKKTGVSISELIRELLDEKIQPTAKVQALRKEMVGLAKSPKGDLSQNHDKYLYT